MHWEPFATSTPLRPISIDANAKRGICPVRPTVFAPDATQKKFDDSKIFRSERFVKFKTKTIGKNRSRAYFDLSSSSDEDDFDRLVEKNRPVIKINSGNTERIKLLPVNGKCDVAINVSKHSSSTIKKLSRTSCVNEKSKNQKRNRTVTGVKSATFNSDLENRNISTNDETNLPICAKNLPLENNKSLCRTSECLPKCKKEKSFIISKIPVLKVNNENHKNKKNPKRLVKHKQSEEINSGLVKKRQVEAAIAENEQILKTLEKQANSSHQLFTDNTQEQLINSLCLTTPEGEELFQNNDFLKIKPEPITRSVKNKAMKEGNSIKCDVVEIANHSQKQRPQRTRQAPKKYWLVNDKPKSGRITRKNNPAQCKSIKPVGSCLTNHSLVPEKLSSDTLTTTGKKKVLDVIDTYKQEVKKLKSGPETKTQLALSMKSNEVPLENKTENAFEHPVFLPLSEVSYLENQFGQQVSQVCEMKNFKCGIFKLKPGSSFTWKKSQRNNYMGGVLVKGKMSMIIEDKEQILQEGDMVVVPPLRKCQTKNIGACDFIFYYWCNKFK